MFGSMATIAPPSAAQPSFVAAGELDPVVERVLRRALELDVDRQPDGVAGLRRLRLAKLARRPAARVDGHLRRARDAVEVLVERRLDAGLADPVVELVLLQPADLELVQRLVLVGRDPADVAERLREQALRVVVAEIGGLDLDAGELRRVLVDVRRLVGGDPDLERHRRRRDRPVVLCAPRAGAVISARPLARAPWRAARSRRSAPCPSAGRRARRGRRSTPC